ncbi:MAG: transglutaminase domain-containing protein [Solobacterium sp.]|nr:transglutaminase domain-containing protein [Solobacterium sp.]
MQESRRKQIPVIVLLAVLSTGCVSVPENNVQATPDIPEETTVPVREKLVEYRYTFDPNVISAEYLTIYGSEIETEFYALCDAVLSVESSFPCPSDERFHQLLAISSSCFPPAQELIDPERTYTSEGTCHLVYRYDEEETKEKIRAFQEKVTEVIRTAVPYDEPDYVKAMELYTAVAGKDRYDDAYTLEDSLKIRSFRAVMEDTGICQEIVSEYIYYLLQAGINAIPCSSLNADQSEAHVWALVYLDGKYYHVDPTYATQYPDSLYFFGMDDKQRSYYGDFPADRFTYAETDVLNKEQYQVQDRRFMKFWLAESYEISHEHRTITITDHNTREQKEYSFDD